MEYATYHEIGTEPVHSVVTFHGASTPVWRQARWDTGEYQQFIRKNGCGHCCAAMALNLHNVKIDPHEEFTLCRALWGEPNEAQEYPQGNYQTVAGITKILRYHGIAAECYGVPSLEDAERRIKAALQDGKQVIFWSHPSEAFPENPFSKGEHYVMAVGYAADGRILIANSSESRAKEGVQFVDLQTILRALNPEAAPEDLTWGERGPRSRCSGYVIVG